MQNSEPATERMAEIFLVASEAYARVYGAPLPRGLLPLGDPDKGWGLRLNSTGERIDDVEPYELRVTWGGSPAGIVGPYGGVIAAGEMANEATLLEWLADVREPTDGRTDGKTDGNHRNE